VRFIDRRLQNIIGDSELDDASTKQFMRLIEQKMESLMKERDMFELAHSQGYVAALRLAIEEVRRNNRKNIVNDEEEE